MEGNKRERELVRLLLQALQGYEERLKEINEKIENLKREKEIVEEKIREMRRELETFKKRGINIEEIRKQLNL